MYTIMRLFTIMGWENFGKKRCFVEILNVDGEKVRKYWGNGADAFEAAGRVVREREERRRDLAVVRAWQDRDYVIDRKVAALDAFIQVQIDRVLVAAGFHFHSGAIRKRQKSKMRKDTNSAVTELKNDVMTGRDGVQREKFSELEDEVRRLSLEALRGIEESDRATLACKVDETIVEVASKVRAMQQEFKLDTASPVERLVIEQVTTAWVQWYVAAWLLESEYCQKRSYRQNQYLERRYTRSQVRLSRAIDQLTKLRCIPRAYLENGKR